jgi:hypothetical protein
MGMRAAFAQSATRQGGHHAAADLRPGRARGGI